MHEQPATDVTLERDGTQPALVENASAEYMGRWNRLVSTTNWEKGRIISAWRQALIEAGAPAGSYSDDAWSRRVGNVSPQHVGRLRRVGERFGTVHRQYEGLYWSHFHAALEWPDAEMWLEGAVHSGWSVAQMRNQRWEATGAAPQQKPRDEEIVVAEADEDVDVTGDAELPESISGSPAEVRPAEAAAADRTELSRHEAASEDQLPADESPADGPASEPLRPFEDLGRLPPDLDAAMESFKLAILHHKLSGWQEVSVGDVLTALEALKQLALTPGD